MAAMALESDALSIRRQRRNQLQNLLNAGNKGPKEQGRPELFRSHSAPRATGATLLRRNVERRCLRRGHWHMKDSGHGRRDLAHIHQAKVAMMRDAGSQSKK